MNNFSKGISKTLIILAVAIIGVLTVGVFAYSNGFLNNNKDDGDKDILSSNEISEKVINFINENLLQGQATASLIEIVEENGLYKIKIKIGEEEFDSYVTKNGKLLFPQVIDIESNSSASEEENEEVVSTIGNFLISEDEICREDGKPIIYFFGSEGCPHCTWEHPIIKKVAKDFEEYILFHNNVNSSTDTDIFQKYSTGGVPALVFGCKYYRVGSGQGRGEEEETKVLTALICKLTQNQPAHICEEVQDLIDQIK